MHLRPTADTDHPPKHGTMDPGSKSGRGQVIPVEHQS